MHLVLTSLKSVVISVFVIILVGLLSLANAVSFPVLTVQPTDTVNHGFGSQNNVLEIYMTNWEDTVAAFSITLSTSHPDVIKFQVGSYDISGTLIEDWEYVNTSGSSTVLKVSGMANTYPPPVTHGIGYPQYGDVPLIKVLYDVEGLPDSMTSMLVDVYLGDSLSNFNFSDELGNSIGVGQDDPTYDTLYYNCIEWVEDECMGWEEVSGPPADTVVIDTVLHPYLDTSLVRIYDGTIELRDCIFMGDANGDYDKNIFDVTYLISYLYLDGPEPPSWATPDANCDCDVNIYDITCIISFLYEVGIPCDECICELWKSLCGQ